MAGPNPLLQLGFISRLKGTVQFNDNPTFNITAPYMGRAGVRLALEGDFTQLLQQMVGVVQSQEVYLPATITVRLVKTTPLANQFKRRWESDSNMGSITFRSDAGNMDPFDFSNCAIATMPGMSADGTEGDFELHLKGSYYVNSNLFLG